MPCQASRIVPWSRRGRLRALYRLAGTTPSVDVASANGSLPPDAVSCWPCRESLLRGMNTSSRRLGRVTAVGSLRRRSPGFGGTSETRRKPSLGDR